MTFKFLGSRVSVNGRCTAETIKSTSQAKIAVLLKKRKD